MPPKCKPNSVASTYSCLFYWRSALVLAYASRCMAMVIAEDIEVPQIVCGTGTGTGRAVHVRPRLPGWAPARGLAGERPNLRSRSGRVPPGRHRHCQCLRQKSLKLLLGSSLVGTD